MSSGKKGKKNKGKTLALQDFLQETPGVVPSVPIRKSTLNWADEVEDSHDGYDSRGKSTSVILPTAPKASRDFDDILEKVSQDPPFIAYLSNLPYDVDENEISYFFKNMKIANMRIPKDDRGGEVPRLKGFGYVEFEDRESLLNALVIPDTTLKNRRIRIEVASDYEDKRRGGRMDMNRDRRGGGEVSMGDWRSGPRTETSDARSDDRRGGGFNRDSDDRRGGGFNRDKEREADSGAWRDGERRNTREPDRSFTRSNDRFSRDDRDDRGFMSRNRFDDRDRRNTGFTRNPPRDDSEPSRSNLSEDKRRPKLVLQPRSKPIEAEAENSGASASIFGSAKPVDTSARERQIEERLLSSEPPLPKRDLSPKPEKKIEKIEKVEKIEKIEKIEKEITQKTDNSVVEKDLPKKNGEQEKKDKDKVEKKKEEKRTDKMPKVKPAEAPNFIGSNKFAFLGTEDSDVD